LFDIEDLTANLLKNRPYLNFLRVMYYGEDIIITRKGIKISAKSLHPIGIEDGSVCWGIVMPPNPKNAAEIVPHLIISAFPPGDWLSLFKLTIKLRDDIGSINKLTTFLTNHRFNVLSTQCALSGYSHATLNITGQALGKKTSKIEEELTRVIGSRFIKNESAFGEENKKFRTDLTTSITLDMLKYSRELQEEIYADGKDDYLHSKLEEFDTLLYKRASAGEADGLDEYAGILPKSVSCRWLQQLATYRIYSEAQKRGAIRGVAEKIPRFRANWENPLRFVYDSRELLLKPKTEADRNKYIETIEKCTLASEIEERKDFPMQVIGAFDPQEQYVRINLPAPAIKNNRLSVQVRYRVDVGLSRENISETENTIKGYLSSFGNDALQLIDDLQTPGFEDVLGQKERADFFEMLADINTWAQNSEFEKANEKLPPLRKRIDKLNGALTELEKKPGVNRDQINSINKVIFHLETGLDNIEENYEILRLKETGEMTALSILQRLSGELRKMNINIEHAANTVLERGRDLESGRISMIIAPEDPSQELRKELRSHLKKLETEKESLLFEEIAIRPLTARRIFVSTKFAFWEDIKPDFKKKLERLVNDYGFTFVTGGNEESENEAGTERHVTERIRTCDGFLQIFPRLPDADMEKDKDWLLFELGVARGQNIPFEICIDENIAGEYSNKITAGKRYKKFDSYQDSKQILEKIEEAVSSLMRRC
jgi:hypothetical protein